MSTYQIYRCDLCTECIKPTEGTNKEGFGVGILGSTLVFKRPYETTRHICQRCVNDVHDELRKIMPAQKVE